MVQKIEDTNNLFHAPCVHLETEETMQILSEAFPDVKDSKGVIPSDNVMWCTLYRDGCSASHSN
jgi:hypothetical protein